jgi:hypothetical protein
VNPIVSALYDSRAEAEQALRALTAELPLAHAGVYDPGEAGLRALDDVALTPEERSACEDKLAAGDYLLLARPPYDGNPDQIIDILEQLAADPPVETPARDRSDNDGAIATSPHVVAEARLPVVEEELRIGIREVVRGGATVRTRVEEIPFAEDVELLSEFVRVASRPASRPISAQELESGGLLRDRVIEIAQVREEAVVSKDVFVREEVVVSKTTERRVERIHETVRRTVVETDELGSGVADERGRP